MTRFIPVVETVDTGEVTTSMNTVAQVSVMSLSRGEVETLCTVFAVNIHEPRQLEHNLCSLKYEGRFQKTSKLSM